MSHWPSKPASRVLAALLRIGWTIKRQSGSHKTLARPGWADYVFAFHEQDEIGPKMLHVLQSTPDSRAKTCKATYLQMTLGALNAFA